MSPQTVRHSAKQSWAGLLWQQAEQRIHGDRYEMSERPVEHMATRSSLSLQIQL